MRCFLLSPRCISFFRAIEKALGKYWNHISVPEGRLPAFCFDQKLAFLHDLPCNFRINMLAKFVCLRKKTERFIY